MRSTLDIIIAVKEDDPVDKVELRLALVALASMHTFLKEDLRRTMEAIENNKSAKLLQMRVGFARQSLEREFQYMKTPVDKYLGEGGIPGTPEQRRRMAWAKGVFKKATGVSLEDNAKEPT